jgi:hypothetical protein
VKRGGVIKRVREYEEYREGRSMATELNACSHGDLSSVVK